MKNYEIEARSRWVNIDTYREHEQKVHKRKQTELNDDLISTYEFCPADEEILKKRIEVYP